MTLTVLERTVLVAMIANADAVAGGDFGLVEELHVPGLKNRHALGGVLTNLMAKGLVCVHEPVETNGGPRRGGELWTQFTISDAGRAAAEAK